MNEHHHILEVSGLKKRYRDFVLGPVDLKIPSGCIVGFIGENGAGKSTTIKSIVGLVHPEGGEVLFEGKPLNPRDKAVFEHIGVGLDELHLPKVMTLIQVGKFCRYFFSSWKEDIFHSYLHRFYLEEKKKMKELSRGMRMKLSLAIALSHQPRLLLLDEATSGLDPIVREEILDILMEFIQDERNSVLISSHILSDLEKTADYIAFIHQGKMVFMEEKDELRERFALFSGSDEEMQLIESRAVIAERNHAYGRTFLVNRHQMPAHLRLLRPSIEEIMLFYLKGERYESTDI